MIADDRETTFEVALKLMTAPVWGPIYFAYLGCRRVAEARARDATRCCMASWLAKKAKNRFFISDRKIETSPKLNCSAART